MNRGDLTIIEGEGQATLPPEVEARLPVFVDYYSRPGPEVEFWVPAIACSVVLLILLYFVAELLRWIP